MYINKAKISKAHIKDKDVSIFLTTIENKSYNYGSFDTQYCRKYFIKKSRGLTILNVIM